MTSPRLSASADPSSATRARKAAGVRLALIDPDDAAHARVRRILSAHLPGWELCSYYEADTALVELPAARPRVAFVEWRLAGHSGLDCVRGLKTLSPGLPIVVFTAPGNAEAVFLSLQAGACGFLVKPAAARTFLSIVALAAEGRLAFCDHAGRLFLRWCQGLALRSRRRALTPREHELLPAILRGLTDKEISQRLHLAPQTVHGRRTNLYRKFGAHSAGEFIGKFLGLTAP